MVSGPDIITYIGIPLAVLGVLPIIYNTITTLATLAKVRRMLRHGRLAGIARGDVINHVIEIELPRYTIAPLHREEQRHEYWRLSEYPSHIPGGTYTTFNVRSTHIRLPSQSHTKAPNSVNASVFSGSDRLLYSGEDIIQV